MRLILPLLLASRVAFGAIALDQKSFKINSSNATTCVTPAITTTGGAGELVVFMSNAEATDSSPTMSDTATLSWTRLNLRTVTSGGSTYTQALWYATTSGNLTTWTATVTGTSSGRNCAVWAFTGAGTPLNWTTAVTGSPSAPSCTITAGTGSYLVGIGSDDTTGGSLTARSGTTANQGSGAAADWFFDWYTTTSVTGSTTLGFSTGAADNYAAACAEIPASGGGGGGSTTHTLTLMGVGS